LNIFLVIKPALI